ncbi:MAG: hypothetical protein CTY33_00135 [Methylotenera sp.]|nr:MAG: hypothetical protein CTY33_00135 [Methylotenera sp.]
MFGTNITDDEIDYPRDIFAALIMKGSPYAFYLFQWVDYEKDAFQYRLKIQHDVKLYDGTVIEGCYPNANSFHGGKTTVKDSDVEFIRISKKQLGYEYKDPRKAANESVSV